MHRFNFIILIVIVLVLAHCKKEYRFPEDPGKSKKTPKERLLGDWKLKEYTLNGISILDSLNKTCPCSLSDDILLSYFYIKDENKWDFDITGFGTTGYHSYTAFNDYHY
ncbi:MAG TPA: hypothetical protein PLQ93_09505, partial [Bacteroidia bacterium]|nr:hypothetical protein [Bacteroidia bacterium]